MSDFEKEYHHLQFPADAENDRLKRELQISVAAGDIVGRLYDAFLKQYQNPESERALHSLNVLCVRLVFCLYAEDAGIFGRRGMFHDYLAGFEPERCRRALLELFKVLDTRPEQRDPYLEPELAEFPYVNGGLFQDNNIEIPMFTREIWELVVKKACDFNWSEISPTIFGAVFESTLNPETKRSGGMHYTSQENIHKVIAPLFLDALKKEFAQIKAIRINKTRQRKLLEFQKKLSSLRFLDPACGSGNFLTETYLSLRRLENEILRILADGKISFGFRDFTPIQVSIAQFYGLEINDFAVTVARTALWIAESQMHKETEDIVLMNLDFLPLSANSHIVETNALQIDWQDIVPKNRLNYIIGNPPFSGARMMNARQKADLHQIFAGWNNVGNLDYVACWFKKCADMMQGTAIRSALVATNSITQGEAVALLWKPLFSMGVHIDFAWRSFAWESETRGKAIVHCVIVGFSVAPSSARKIIYSDREQLVAEHINGYLQAAEDVFVESRQKPLCPVPEIGIGNKPIDGGHYLFRLEEKNEFVKKEPAAQKWFRMWYGADEFIHRRPRYCLYLGNCSPNELRQMPECRKRVQAVREYRLASKSPGTVKLADRPTHFHVENMPTQNYILIPRVSSQQRFYVPIGFMTPDILCSDAVHIIPGAGLYHFSVLTSIVHMAWMRAVCGRLGMGYRYSKEVVYNNFPWPRPTAGQKRKMEQCARAILNARELFPEADLADLYDAATMPVELRQAHQVNDQAVLRAYGFSHRITENELVEKLLKMYQQLATNG